MISKTCETYWAKIYLAGPIDQAAQTIRRYCKTVGLCVTLTPTDYIYKGGQEAGYVVTLNNYPRFPKTEEEILKTALDLAGMLRDHTYQDSFMVQTPDSTHWLSEREDA